MNCLNRKLQFNAASQNLRFQSLLKYINNVAVWQKRVLPCTNWCNVLCMNKIEAVNVFKFKSTSLEGAHVPSL